MSSIIKHQGKIITICWLGSPSKRRYYAKVNGVICYASTVSGERIETVRKAKLVADNLNHPAPLAT